MQHAIALHDEVDRAELAAIAAGPGAAEAHRLWHAGLTVPYWVTTALDVRELDGPEVDEACGTQEPAVDLWEAGQLYPEWEELLRLALLTGFPVGFFTRESPEHPLRVSETSLRFHMPLPPEREPVLAFTRAAIEATLAGPARCPACLTIESNGATSGLG